MAAEYTVMFEGEELTLTAKEYAELKDAAYFDPPRAQELALNHLANKEKSKESRR